MNYEPVETNNKVSIPTKFLRHAVLRLIITVITVTTINIVSLPIARALDLETVFMAVVSDILHVEYEKKNFTALQNYMEYKSLEELLFSAEHHNQSAQRILFYIYYIVNSTLTNIIQLTDKTVLQLSPAQITRIENLIQKTKTPPAYFSLGFSYIKTNDKEKGLHYLHKAKDTGYALAYLVIPALTIKTESLSPDTKKQNMEIIYQSLQEIQKKGINNALPPFNFLMGTVLFLKKQYSNALKFFDDSIHKQKFAIAASMTYRGIIHQRNNRTSLAKKNFIKAIKKGNDESRVFLIKIYISEGNYTESSELLKEISTKWGKYKDVASIKASLLLSYMLKEGLGIAKNLMQSYIYANRAKEIYLLSQQQSPLFKVVDPNTGRYQVWIKPGWRVVNFSNNITENNTQFSLTKYHTLPTQPNLVFELINFENNDLLTEKQLHIIKNHISTLEKQLQNNEKLQEARFLASTDFENLYMPNKCGRVFLN